MTGTVHSQAPFELRAGKPKCGVDFLTFIFPPPSPMQTQIMDKDDEAVSYEVLEQFCGIRAGTMRRMAAKNEPQNAFLSLGGCRRPRFLTFGWCMCPTEIPHCYTIKTCKRGGEAIADTITFRDNSAKYPRTPPAADTPISQPTSGSAGTDDACARPLPQRAIVQAGVDLPSPTLLRAHAAITGVLELSGAGDVFFDLFRLCFWSDSPYPPTSGTPFWESVVAYEGQDICWEVDAHNPLDPEE
ncbi:hypothetical protein BD309DRAFT_298025 [Dichomitus squalens]|nr:hypothetical protein BD309DRAFT_298025 [Dichomitus squalens]